MMQNSIKILIFVITFLIANAQSPDQISTPVLKVCFYVFFVTVSVCFMHVIISK